MCLLLAVQLVVKCRQRNKEKFESLQQEVEALTSSLQHLEMEKQKLETETSMLRAQQQKAGTSGSTQPSLLLGLKKVATPAHGSYNLCRLLFEGCTPQCILQGAWQPLQVVHTHCMHCPFHLTYGCRNSSSLSQVPGASRVSSSFCCAGRGRVCAVPQLGRLQPSGQGRGRVAGAVQPAEEADA